MAIEQFKRNRNYFSGFKKVQSNSIDAQFNLTFSNRDNNFKRTFDPSVGSGYKRDYRLTGRYFNLEVAMSGSINPELTGMDLEVIPSGTR